MNEHLYPITESEILQNPQMPLRGSPFPSCSGKAVKISKVFEVHEDEPIY